MPVDEPPEPDEDAVLRDTACDDDYQAAYDQTAYHDANDARQWVRAALSVLTAAIPAEEMCPMQLDAVREARTEAGRLIARTFRGLIPDRHIDS